MRRGNYILDENGKPVYELDLVKWAHWMSSHDKHVGKDVINGVTVSTVFLGIDHNFNGSGPPLLWETMVFGGKLDEYCERCCSSEQAEAMHARIVARVKELLKVDL